MEEIITAFDKAEPKCGCIKTSAAPENLFTVNNNRKKLHQDKTVEFHYMVAKPLYATNMVRLDLYCYCILNVNSVGTR